MKLKIWWNSNFGEPNFEWPVKDIDEAKYVLNLLAEYDLYLAERVDANAGGLIVLENGEWVEWYDENGDSIDEIMRSEENHP